MVGRRAALDATVDPAGEVLYFHAGTGEGDGGLYSLNIDSGDLANLVPPVSMDGPGSRIGLEWSSSGQVLASSLCDLETCDVDVVTTTTGEVRRIESRMTLRATSDQFLLGEDGVSGPFVLADLASGAVNPVAKDLIADAHEGYAVDGDRFLLGGLSHDRSEYRIVIADAASGATELIASQPAADALVLTRLGKSADWAVLATETVADLWAKGGGSLSLLDIQAKSILEDAVEIQPDASLQILCAPIEGGRGR
jgi:hypothetical protein